MRIDAYSFDESWHQRFISEKRHVVGIGIEPTDEISTVNIDNVGIMKQMCNAIIANGNKKFMYFAGYENCYVSDQRLRGMLEALEENGVTWHGGTAKAWANTDYSRIMDPVCMSMLLGINAVRKK